MNPDRPLHSAATIHRGSPPRSTTAIAAVDAGAATVDGLDLHLLALDPTLHRMHYDVVSNAVLWYLHHGLFDLTRRPRFDHHFQTAWEGYVAVNATFADTIVARAGDGEQVIVHDYQLALVPGMVRAARPDLRIAHFTHTPFCGPNSIRVLPTHVARELCGSMATVPAGFHTTRWMNSYEASARLVLDADAEITPPFAVPLGPDPAALARLVASPPVASAAAELDELVGDRRLILRSDRIDPAKNIVRGFLAYDRLFETHPEWRERVVFVALLNRSRQHLAEYLAYQQEVEQTAERVNDRWGTGEWQPIVVDTRDDYEQTVAGLTRYDVLLVNSLKDGLNLVAKEGPIVNARHGVLALSPEAGRLRRPGRRRPRGAPLRHRAGGERAPRCAGDARRRAHRAGRHGCASWPARTTRRTGSPNCSAALADRLRQVLQQHGEAGRPVDDDVGGEDLGRRLGRSDADAHGMLERSVVHQRVSAS